MAGEETRQQFGAMGMDASGDWYPIAVTQSGEIITQVSGQVVLISGQVGRVEGYDYESGVWRSLRVTQSGELAIHVDIVDIVQARISGQTVIAKISGEAVRISGQLVPISGAIYAEVSGQVVARISGQTVISKVSGEALRISGQMVGLMSGQRVIGQISGQLIPISGAIYAEVSGQVIAKISGQRIVISNLEFVTPGQISVSGNSVLVSGEAVRISGQLVAVSGRIDLMVPNLIRTRDFLVPTAGSGGTALDSGVCVSVTIKSLSGDVLIGGDSEPPMSGHGFLLAAGEAVTYDLDNLPRVRVMARLPANSGNWVSYTANDIT